MYIEQTNEKQFLQFTIRAFPSYNPKSSQPSGVIAIQISGPSGIAKTLLAEELAEDDGAKCFSIDGGPDVEKRDIEGGYVVEGKIMIYKCGKLKQAIDAANDPEGPGVSYLIINEVNAMRPAEMISMNGVISEKKVSPITKPEDTWKIMPGKKMVVIVTFNPGYMGTRELQEAFEDRFDINQILGYPSKPKMIEIIQKVALVSKDFAKLITETGTQLRLSCTKDMKIARPFSPRRMISFAYHCKLGDAKYIDNYIQTMVINKICTQGPERKRQVTQANMILKGTEFKTNCVKFMNEMKKPATISETMPKPIKKIKAINGPETGNVIKDMKILLAHYASTKGRDHIIKPDNTMRWAILRTMWEEHQPELKAYFDLTVPIFGAEYEKDTNKKPMGRSAKGSTNAYINWVYKDRKQDLIDFITKAAPVFTL